MTDVVTHADPTPPGDGRRGPHRHRQLGLRVPHGAPRPATDGVPDPDDDGPRHRRSPGTAPVAVPAAGEPGTSRHRAARRGEAFDPATGSIPTAGRTVTAGATAAAAPTATGATGATHAGGVTDHAAPRRTVPLRATVGLLGVGGIAAVFALTAPGVPAPTPSPAEAPPQLAAPAGFGTPVLPGPPRVVLSPPPVVPMAPVVPVAPAAPVAPVAPPTASTTTPTGEESQPVVGALFDAAAGAFSSLFNNNGREGLVENGPRPRIVENPDDPDREAWQFSLGAGGKRSEVLPRGEGAEPEVGDEQFIRYTAQLSEDFPTDTSSWQLILQWHHTSPTGSPPLALQVTQGQLMMVSNGDDMQAIGPVSPGDRIDLTMNVVFSDDPSESSVTVWRDGRPTGVTDWSPRDGTMSTEAAYLKMGLYRDTDIRQPGSVLVTDLKIGRNAAGIGGIGPRPAG